MPVKNIVLTGFMGTGKSTLASWLSSRTAMEMLDMDQMIAEREGMSIPDIFHRKGEKYFREKETELLREVQEKKNIILSCGGGVVLRDENVKIMKKIGTVVLLEATPEVLYERVKNDANRPLLNDRMCVEQIREMKEERRERYQVAADIVIDTCQHNLEELGREILTIIQRMEEENV